VTAAAQIFDDGALMLEHAVALRHVAFGLREMFREHLAR